MTPIFADTFYYLALLSQDDAAHGAAVELSRKLRCPIVTTAWVMTEVADGLAKTSRRTLFAELLRQLRSDPHVVVMEMSCELFDRGVELYSNRADKEWSLTDCISFVAMDDHRLSEALTADHHFEQAGFTILLK